MANIRFIVLLATGLQAQPDDILHWNTVALQYQEKGRFREAHEAYKRAINSAERSAITPATRLRLQLNLASLYLEEQAYGSAEQLIRAAESRVPELPQDSPELAGLYNVAGTLRLIDGELSAAQQSFEKALAILDRPGFGHGDELASILLNLGTVQMRQGRYGEARHNLDRTVALLKEVGEALKSQLIRALASRSTLEYLMKKWTSAERDAAQALALAESNYGKDSPIVGELLQNYALILDRLRRGEEARSYRARVRALLPNGPSAFRQVIDVTELGSDRPAVTTK